tara:strand:- start:16 stop:234 length:219 start_codon:yes stop_codon:yes gene_type:complete
MADSLVSALERVHLSDTAADDRADDWIDSILEEQRPRKRIKQSPEDLKRELEEKYLTPSTSFSVDWLNKLQQ